MVEEVAKQIALAVDNLQAYEESQRLRELSERPGGRELMRRVPVSFRGTIPVDLR